MELLNHLFGTCGENHPNIFTVSIVVGILTFVVSSISKKIKTT